MKVLLISLLLVQEQGTRGFDVPEAVVKSDRFMALLIGIDVYEDRVIPALKTPENDVVALADVLEGRYSFEKPILLLGPKATEQGIRNALEDLVARAGKRDNVLIYFAGRRGRKGTHRLLDPSGRTLGRNRLLYFQQ